MNKIQTDLQGLSIASKKQQSCITDLYLELQQLSNAFEYKVTGKFQGIINWDHLRMENLVNICKFLPLKQLLNLRLVNKSFYNRINYGMPLFIQYRKEKIENIQSQKQQVDDTQILKDISDSKQILHQLHQEHVNELRSLRIPHQIVMELLQRTLHLLSNKEINEWGQICSGMQTIRDDLLHFDMLLLSRKQVQIFQNYMEGKSIADFNKYSIFCGQLFQFLERLNEIMNTDDYQQCQQEKEKENQIIKLQNEIDLLVKISKK